MNIKCALWLHNWTDDCEKCIRCGKMRSHPHDWTRDCEQCAKCKQKRYTHHTWNGCRCSTCGSARLDGHQWQGETCGICGDTKSQALDKEVRQACLVAMQRQNFDHDFSSSFETRQTAHLREALRPVADKWGHSVDYLLRAARRMVETDEMLTGFCRVLRRTEEMKAAIESRLRG